MLFLAPWRGGAGGEEEGRMGERGPRGQVQVPAAEKGPDKEKAGGAGLTTLHGETLSWPPLPWGPHCW